MQHFPSTGTEAADAKRHWWAGILLRSHQSWLGRFARQLQQFAALGRGQQRRLTRKASTTLAGAALLLALGGAVWAGPLAPGNTITTTPGSAGIANGDGCSLVEAIINANNDAATHAECATGSGDDTIVLTGEVYAYAAGYAAGSNALPIVTSVITIEGNKTTIERSGGAPEFRLFEVAAGGDLTLNAMTVRGGKSLNGGAIYSLGSLTVRNATISNNEAGLGGGIFSGQDSVLTVQNTDIVENKATSFGGGIMAGLNKVTISDSNVENNTAENDGGGLAIFGSEGTISGTSIRENTAVNQGGGLLVSSVSTVSLSNSQVSGNGAKYGGGIAVNYESSLTVSGGFVDGNTATEIGGGIAAVNSGSLTIDDVTISNNNAASAAGVAIAAKVTMTATKMQLLNNEATSGAGGGLYVAASTATVSESVISGNISQTGSGVAGTMNSTVTLSRSTVSGNTAGAYGGGILNYQSTMTIDRSTLYNNTAVQFGGAIRNDGQMDITNSTLNVNAAGAGGGIFNSSIGKLNVRTTTIVGNSAVGGGGLWNDSPDAVLWGSVVSGNTGSSGAAEIMQSAPTLMTAEFNVLGHAGVTDAKAFHSFTPGASNFNATTDGTPTALTSILEPALGNNGGPTLTNALVAGSPAIDLAPSADCAAAPVSGIDQRGEPRNVNGNGAPSATECDAGAYEFNPAPPTPTVTATPTVSATPTSTPGPSPTPGPTAIPGAEKSFLPFTTR